jgi:hypothetical protein
MDEEKEFEEVYDDEAREDLVENDEISAEEEGFMSGYEERKEKTKEDTTGDDVYEKSFAGREKDNKTKRTAKPEKTPAKVQMKSSSKVSKAPAKPRKGQKAVGKAKKK